MLVDKKYISLPVSESELGKRNRQLSILLEMSNFLSTKADPAELLLGALSKILEIFDLEAGRIYLMDDGGEFLHLAAQRGVEAKGLEKVSMAEGFSGKSARTRSFIAQHISELEDKRRAELLKGKGLRYIICVPLITMDRVTGVMNLAAGRMIQLDQEKIDLLIAIGNQIAVAVNNTRLNEELKNQIEIIKGKKEMVKFFAYSVSHDLKSPALGLYGLTKRLRDKYIHILDDKGKEICDQILKASGQMVDLVGKINEFIATREAPLSLEKFELKEITESIRGEVLSILKQRNIKWSETDVLPEIIADKLAILRVFRNLIDNALKYGGTEMSEIKIGHKEDDVFHILSVSDDGVGINGAEKEKVFELFQRNETARGKAGSGLGLAIVKEIAERHQGRAWIEMGKEMGVTFFVSVAKHLEAIP